MAAPDEPTRALTLLVASARRLVLFSGAGASAESGIPTYRSPESTAVRTAGSPAQISPGGLWDRYRPMPLDEFLTGDEQRHEFWQRSLGLWPVISGAAPNAGHAAAKLLADRGVLAGVITQNIDGLYQKAGVPDARVVELHGTAHRVRCLACRVVSPRAAVQARVVGGECPPACLDCGGILKPETVFFGEAMPRGRVAAAMDLAKQSDVFLVVGTSLVVQPAASLPREALAAGARLAVVNPAATWLDARADVVVRAGAAVTLGAVVQQILGTGDTTDVA